MKIKTFDPRNHGFTLIELLVVMAVVAILASITVPAIRSAKEKAQQAECLSNMHQIGLAVHMYLNDHDEAFPPCLDYIPWRVPLTYVEGNADLAFVLNNYIGNNDGSGTNNMSSKVWVCPFAKRYGRKGVDAVSPEPYKLGNFDTPSGWGPKYDLTYRWNSLTTRDGQSMDSGKESWTRAVPQTAKGLVSPGRAALLWDLPDYLTFYNLPMHAGEPDRLNCLFVDGHVDLVKVVPGAAPVDTLWWHVGYGPGQGWEGIGNDPVN